MGNIKIDFEPRNGGGSTTYLVLKGIIDDRNRMCLCIIDSDKKYGNASPRETMQKVQETVKDVAQDHFEVVCLDVHEVENLIPLDVLETIVKKLNVSDQAIEFMRFLIGKDSTSNSPAFYFDLKKGIPQSAYVLEENPDKERRSKFNKLNDFRVYWKPYIDEYGGIIGSGEDTIISGVCDKTLRMALAYFEGLKQEEKTEIYTVDPYLQSVWMEIGEKVYCWGCVGGRIAV